MIVEKERERSLYVEWVLFGWKYCNYLEKKFSHTISPTDVNQLKWIELYNLYKNFYKKSGFTTF